MYKDKIICDLSNSPKGLPKELPKGFQKGFPRDFSKDFPRETSPKGFPKDSVQRRAAPELRRLAAPPFCAVLRHDSCSYGPTVAPWSHSLKGSQKCKNGHDYFVI